MNTIHKKWKSRHLPTKLGILTSSLPFLHPTSTTGGATSTPTGPSWPTDGVIKDVACRRLLVGLRSSWLCWVWWWWSKCRCQSYLKFNKKLFLNPEIYLIYTSTNKDDTFLSYQHIADHQNGSRRHSKILIGDTAQVWISLQSWKL